MPTPTLHLADVANPSLSPSLALAPALVLALAPGLSPDPTLTSHLQDDAATMCSQIFARITGGRLPYPYPYPYTGTLIYPYPYRTRIHTCTSTSTVRLPRITTGRSAPADDEA